MALIRSPTISVARRRSSAMVEHDDDRTAIAETVVRDSVWMAVGVIVLLVFTLAVLHFQSVQNSTEQLALKARRTELVDRMRVALASAAEAEKSTVLAVTDEDSQMFADQARASTGTVDQARQNLGDLLNTDGTANERELLGQFSQAFAELQRIDDEVLSLAVKNTNLKGYTLVYGPATDALKTMHDSLTHLVATTADARVTRLALGADVAALRVQTMLPPHIAEARDEKMDEMEGSMRGEEDEVHKDLDALRALRELDANADLQTAAAAWQRFREIKAQVIALSRENTNVRSLTMSLDRKRSAMLAAQQVLASLRQAIDDERIAGVDYGRPARPR